VGVARMKKVGLIFHRELQESVLNELFELGVLEVRPFTGELSPELRGSKLEEKLERIKDSIAYLKTFKSEKEEKEGGRPIAGACPSLLEETGEKLVAEIEKNRKELESIEAEIKICESNLKSYEPWGEIQTPLSKFKTKGQTGIVLGSVPQNLFRALTEALSSEPLIHYEEVKREGGTSYLIIFYHKSAKNNLEEILAKFEFSKFEPAFDGTFPEESAKIRAEMEILENKKRKLINRLCEVAKNEFDVLLTLEEYYTFLKEREEALLSGKEIGSTRFLQGWIIEKDYKQLKNSLEKKFGAVAVFELEQEENETPPVALDNIKPIKPIEIITDLYGRPRKGMIDPTPIIAPFYATYFAFCLSDAGYGLIIAAIASLILWKIKNEGLRKIARFLLLMGFASIGAGIIMGGYFGLDIESSNSALAKTLVRLKLFDPLRDALFFFALTIIFGSIQVALGFILRGYIQFREFRGIPAKAKAVVLAVSWAMIVLSGGSFMGSYLRPSIFNPLIPLAQLGLLSGACGILFGSLIFGLLEGESLFKALWQGVGFDGLYGIIGVMGDLLSFSRILALGLSSGVIAGVINIIVKQLKGIPVLGLVLVVLVFALGHIGLSLISALGAFVHPARLQFVEFFTKFYEGGGKPFRPLSRTLPLKNIK